MQNISVQRANKNKGVGNECELKNRIFWPKLCERERMRGECLLTEWMAVRFCCHQIELDKRKQRAESHPLSNTYGSHAAASATPIPVSIVSITSVTSAKPNLMVVKDDVCVHVFSGNCVGPQFLHEEDLVRELWHNSVARRTRFPDPVRQVTNKIKEKVTLRDGNDFVSNLDKETESLC